ncbi:MAG: hypothetical protein LBE07_01255 [Gordonia sp. (in: high G+C Gram-positive bacteria)]|jgi:hypothetical protein|nr:hypothetical protein [Gordonia sp. (in: high G+C Gram-positive bacteria)]
MTSQRGALRSRPLVAGGVLLAVAALVASSVVVDPASPGIASSADAPALTVIDDASVPPSVLVSRTLVESSSTAVVLSPNADESERRKAVDVASSNKIPLFQIDDAGPAPVAAELARLDVEQVIGIGSGLPDLGVAVADTASTAQAIPSAAASGDRLVLVAGGDDALATAEAAGVTAVGVPVADPRSSGEAVAALKSDPDRPILAIGAFGTEETISDRITAARTVPELPGGGQLVFPGRRMVALYGSPGGADLGPLGAQGVDASIRRIRRVAEPYRRLSDTEVVPAFEIIVTVASADPGYQGKYTNIIDPEVIRPWIDAAGKAGVYVTLDLQPGRMDFLTQAKMYRDLLKEPHVGLALDPEWRLKPKQVHLTQIGAVDPAEVNKTADWLAELVRTENLPQKVFVLHQFDADMLGDRSLLDTSHPELATVIHADGHGTPTVKRATYDRIVDGLPPNVWLGWKNFYKEDKPMFSPRQTLRVLPEPWFISYQ